MIVAGARDGDRPRGDEELHLAIARRGGLLDRAAGPDGPRAAPAGYDGTMRWLIACLVASCYRGTPPAPAPPEAPGEPMQQAAAPEQSGGLYALDEAVADALEGPWEHVGTGEWFGIFRVNACVYRTARVFVVNIYCTPREKTAFGLVVLSPARGRAYIYAEAKAPISGLRRADYFTFKGEAAPALADERLPPLELGFSYRELRAWDERRYHRYVPACYGGVEIGRPQGGCLGELEPRAAAWAERNRAFLDEPPEGWYRLIEQLRARVGSDARRVTRPGR